MNNYTEFAQLLAAKSIKAKIDEPMSKRTSFKIGGPADVFVCVQTRDELKTVIQMTKDHNIPLTVVGNGSNLLVSDKGIRGVVVSLDGDFCSLQFLDGNKIVAGAGTMLSHLCQFAHGNSLTGLEFAYGIPGSVGGAIYMNAGAYGGEMKDVAVACEYITMDGEINSLTIDQMELDYRKSFFTGKDYIILSATFVLEKGDKERIKGTMRELMGKRSDKQPLELPSAGSAFKRPVGYFAGALIEQCGLKGCTVGGAQVSEKHAGFIVNIGNATCEDVLGLVRHIQETVKKETGVDLESEIRAIGEGV